MSNFGLNPLNILAELQHPVADLVKDYLAKHPDWKVDDWFLRRTNAIFQNESPALEDLPALDEISFGINRSMDKDVRLFSIHPHYFRGFRKVENAIDISGNLVVIDGRNSSGKTSLAEAIEWVLTGHLVRRELGDPKELAECIANRFKPDKELTCVECMLDSNGERVSIKRLLVNDYDSTKHSCCKTRLFIDDSEVSDSYDVLESVFGGVSPQLMQHTLRQFVLQNPTDRRSYFERLLSLDDITSLIQNAVVGNTGLAQFSREHGGEMLNSWNELKRMLPDSQSKLLSDVDRCEPESVANNLGNALHSVAVSQFGLDSQLNLESMLDQLSEFQRKARQGQFPLLEKLRPKKSLDAETMSQLSDEIYVKQIQRLKEEHEKFEAARETEQRLLDAEEAIASAFTILQDNGLISDAQQQICPLCDFEETPTLSKQRIEVISIWNGVRKILSNARNDFHTELQSMLKNIKTLATLRQQMLPQLSEDEDWGSFEAAQINERLIALKTEYQLAKDELRGFDELSVALSAELSSKDVPTDLESKLTDLVSILPRLVRHAQKYSRAFDNFEVTLGELASSNLSYAARENWINVHANTDELIRDLKWENSKAIAQHELKQMREALIKFRQKYLDARRQEFSDGMTEIWSLLREDWYSGFKQISIPKPSGKGFPVRIEVKALLDNGSEPIEVDALKVLSESQINVIGIAAFVTRSRLIGHRCLIFDDPVQSMDDEHFKTFANELLSHLCDLGFQVVVLTHSDLFARDISHYHYDRPDYVTMDMRYSRRHGVKIEEGNRKVAERLKVAEKLAEDGNLAQAWYFVRLAVERMYTVLQIKYGPEDFDPRSWADQSAEYMWNEGVDKVFARNAPGNENRLKEILDLAAAGGHDKPKPGATDLKRAVKDMRPLLSKLKIGG